MDCGHCTASKTNIFHEIRVIRLLFSARRASEKNAESRLPDVEPKRLGRACAVGSRLADKWYCPPMSVRWAPDSERAGVLSQKDSGPSERPRGGTGPPRSPRRSRLGVWRCRGGSAGGACSSWWAALLLRWARRRRHHRLSAALAAEQSTTRNLPPEQMQAEAEEDQKCPCAPSGPSPCPLSP